MQVIDPLTIEDFEKDSILVISKVEIDSDGEGTFQELLDVKTYNISTNEENRVAKFCSYSFSITCLNTDNRYNPLNSGSNYYEWLKQGRKIKLYAGIPGKDPFQLILGRVDDFKLGKKAGQDICTITGRCLMRMVLDFKLYSPNTYWGTSHLYNTVANQIRYDMEADCKGVYRVFLDSTSPYDGSKLEEIYENTDWSYDWHNNQLVFTPRRIPDFAGTNNLKVYYFQTQNVEDVVADILLAAGIFANETEKNTWLASGYCTSTEKTIERVRFNAGTSALKAITLLSEVVQYRFYFDYAGNPIFKTKPSAGSPVNTISDYENKVENVEESVDETYTHIIVIGEERDRILGDDEVAPDVPTGLALSTGLGLPTQASLAWIKAEWEANTESDFGHYELRIRKTADSDYTEVSTIATSFIWYGLEPGVEYGVQIRAVDIYNNRSAWSTEVTKVTATDATTPAQITGAVATAIFAGVKIEWNAATEDNIAGYIVERQESPDNVDWTGAWTERVRLRATMWLDLLLTYSKWYRYKITAYTQAGVEGVTSNFTTAVQPKQAENADIGAGIITATELASNAVTEIKIATDAVTENKIKANAVVADKIYAGAVGTDKLAALAVTAGKIAAAAITTVKIDALAVTTDCLAANAVTAAKIYANTITANEIAAGTITSSEIASGTLLVGDLNSEVLNRLFQSSDYKAAIEAWAKTGAITYIDGGKIYAGSIILTGAAADFNWSSLEDDGNKPDDNADVTASNPQNVAWLTDAGAMAYENLVEFAKLGTTIIVGGYIKTSLLTATNIRAGYLRTVQFRCGGGTDEDIYFEDSGIRLYDAGSNQLIFYKSGLAALSLYFSNGVRFYTGGDFISFNPYPHIFAFVSDGQLKFPGHSTAPTGHTGGLCYKGISPYQFLFFNGSNWEYLYDGSGW